MDGLQFVAEHVVFRAQPLAGWLGVAGERFWEFGRKPAGSRGRAAGGRNDLAQEFSKPLKFGLGGCALRWRGELLIQLRRSRHTTTSRPWRRAKPGTPSRSV